MEDDAVVLKRIEVGESDLILTLLSNNSGKISAIAKGALRSKRRFVNKLEPFTLLTIDYSYKKNGKKNSELAFLHEAELHTIFPRLRYNYKTYLAANVIAEFLLYALQEGERDTSLFSLLLWALQQLDDGAAEDTTILFFLLRAYEHIGYRPELHKCRLCDSKVEGGRGNSFSNQYGGLLCGNCIHTINNSINKDKNSTNSDTTGAIKPLSIAAIKTLQAAQNMPIERLHSLRPTQSCRHEALPLLYHFGRHLLQRDYNSWKDFITLYRSTED